MDRVTEPLDVPFACGAILALCAEIARRAIGDSAEMLVRRRWNMAVDHPRLAYGPMINVATDQLLKIDSGASAVFLRRRLADLCSSIGDEFPARITAEDRFGLGFYHELNELRRRRADRRSEYADADAPESQAPLVH